MEVSSVIIPPTGKSRLKWRAENRTLPILPGSQSLSRCPKELATSWRDVHIYGFVHLQRYCSLDIDLTTPDFVADPYPLYAHLRSEQPVFFSERYQAWFLSRYKDIKAVFANEKELGFSSVFQGPADLQPTWSETSDQASGFNGYLAIRQKTQESQQLWIASRDTADHHRLRKEFNPPFMPATLKIGEPDVRELVHRILDGLAHRSGADAIADLGIPLTTSVFLNLMGVDHSHKDWILAQSLDLSKLFFLDTTPREKEQGLAALTVFMEFFKKRIADRSALTDGGLISHLLQGQCMGRISMDEILSNLAFFILAGMQSTIHLIGNMFYCLMKYPEQLEALKATPALVESFIEEVLRLETVNAYSTRSAFDDIEIGGQRIGKGQRMVLLNGSANRDETVFKDSDTFMADRQPNAHLAFGFGTRYCIGAYLSRQEAKILLETLLERFPRFTVDPRQELNWFYNFRIRGLDRIHLNLQR